MAVIDLPGARIKIGDTWYSSPVTINIDKDPGIDEDPDIDTEVTFTGTVILTIHSCPVCKGRKFECRCQEDDIDKYPGGYSDSTDYID